VDAIGVEQVTHPVHGPDRPLNPGGNAERPAQAADLLLQQGRIPDERRAKGVGEELVVIEDLAGVPRKELEQSGSAPANARDPPRIQRRALDRMVGDLRRP
jgi:hypothetical protein